MTLPFSRWLCPMVLSLAVLSACGPGEAVVGADEDDAAERGQELVAGLRGRPLALDVAQWNVMWLGNTSFGPTDEAAQSANVASLIRSANVDLWALQEVSSQAAFEGLVAALPGYDGVSATSPSVAGGTAHYSSQEQRPALLFKRRALTVRAARLVPVADESAFAGRPPLEVELTATINRKTLEFTVVVVHLKAGAGLDDRARRQKASEELAAHVATLSGAVLVLGDWNDETTRSIVPGQPSPFANWPSDWSFLTRPLEVSGARSSVFGSFIDHATVNAALAPAAAGTSVFDPSSAFADYRHTTSDHFPVLHFFNL
ncbi:MAG: endonuclease/exonuclease/phosphatase family protein [Myxococcaceae bacterium]